MMKAIDEIIKESEQLLSEMRNRQIGSPHTMETPMKLQQAPMGFNPFANEHDVYSVTKLVTPREAKCLRETAHFSRQRNISKANIARLANEMTAGRFIPGTQIYIGVLPDGQQLIINGNHTLEAVCESNAPQVLTFTYKLIKDEDEAGLLYAVFDIHKTRTWADSLRGMGHDKNLKDAGKVLAAIGVLQNRFDQGSVATIESRPVRIERMKDYEEAADLFAAALAGAPVVNTRLVKRAAAMAVALETLRYQPSAAFEFWHRIGHGVNLAPGMPELALLRWLQNAHSTARRETARAAASAWNAAFEGRSIGYCKPNAMKHFVLLGTPHEKGIQSGKPTV